jgi:hypothetical protein
MDNNKNNYHNNDNHQNNNNIVQFELIGSQFQFPTIAVEKTPAQLLFTDTSVDGTRIVFNRNKWNLCLYFYYLKWSLKKIIFLSILSIIIFLYIIFIIIYGAYEFTYNFNITIDNAGLQYDIKSSDRYKAINDLNFAFLTQVDKYKMSSLVMYISNIIYFTNILIIILSYIHKIYDNSRNRNRNSRNRNSRNSRNSRNRNKSNCSLIIFSIIMPFSAVLYLISLIFSLIYNTLSINQVAKSYSINGYMDYDYIIFPHSLLSCQPLDTKIFMSFLYVLFGFSAVCLLIFMCIACCDAWHEEDDFI